MVSVVGPRHVLLSQTNYYHDFCQGALPHHMPDPDSKHVYISSTLGRAKWPDGGVNKDDIWGVFGILMHMGFCKMPRMKDHWCQHELANFPTVRACMTRELFSLVYSRFLHFALPCSCMLETVVDRTLKVLQKDDGTLMYY